MMTPVKDWKASPLTLGLLVALVVACVTVVGWVVKGQSAIKDTAAEVVKMHCDADVDRAHRNLREKYVPRVELQQSLNGLQRQLDRMEQTQQVILKRIAEPRRRHGSPGR